MKTILTSLLFFLVFIGYSQEYVHSAAPKFQNLNFEDGISNLSVFSFEQDEQGYIWMGTARGLNRYDGITFKQYLYNDDDHSLYHNLVVKVHKNFEGKLFCATGYGVNMFNPTEDKMYRIESNNEMYIDFIDFDDKTYGISYLGGMAVYNANNQSFEQLPDYRSNAVIEGLLADQKTGIWGKTTDNKSLINFDPRTKILKKYDIPRENDSFKGGDILKIDDILLLASGDVKAFSLSLLKFVDLPEQYSKLEELTNYDFTFINEIDNGFLWIGTKNNGLFIYNPVLNSIVNLKKSNSNLQSNNLTTVFKDRDNNIWLGTFDQGADVSFKQRNNFNFEIELDNLTSNKFVTSITTDTNTNYYIGTRSEGLYIYRGGMRRTGKNLNQDNSKLKDNHIRTLFIDSKNQLWIGSEKMLQIADLNFNTVKEIELPKPNNGIVTFCEQDGKIIAGSDLQGIFIFDYKGNILTHSLALGNNITKIIPTNKEEVIVSAYGSGIFSYNINSGHSQNLKDLVQTGSHRTTEIITMHLDTDSILWLGNFNHGLYKLNLKNKDFRVFTEKDGLPNNDVVSIEEDKDGKLWLGTSFGLSRFDKKEEFVNYFQNEGLQNIQFHQKASLLDTFGTVFMGGNYGLTFFNPKILTQSDNKSAPKIILESLKVATKEILPNDESKILTQILNLTKRITLNHKQKVFTIEYHAFDYIAANKVKYAYKLEGFDQEWNNVGERTFANFTNLRPGSYLFKVKAQNNVGVWSEISSLEIKLKPSPFNTVLAYFIYLLLITIIIYISFKLTLRAKLYKSKLEIEHNERIRENEIAQMKMRFFTNISHEIRTPLTLIKGNTDLLSKDLDSKNIKFDSFKGLQYSTNRLLALVNQLLSVKSLENDALRLKVKKDDIITITKNLIQPFQYAANNRSISIQLESNFDKLLLPIDEDKYEKIMSNLFSNSLKHANENGTIRVKIEMLEVPEYKTFFHESYASTRTSFVKISVIDNGLGIPKNDLPHIFDRFEQSGIDKIKPDYSGTGIGLNFTKRLVELHHGSITVTSKEHIETVFAFVLSLEEKTYQNDIWIKTEPLAKTETATEIIEDTIDEIPKKDQALVLLIEDDLELNRFINTYLKSDFRVISCYNGKEGIKLAQNQLPDVIVSDIMMPEVDGLQLCKLVREDELISHIPIILLTAKTDVESKISGYQYGADDYISKPFELNILKARINNLIKLRKKLQALYKQGILDEHKVEITNQFELNFIKRIETIVASEYQSTKLNVNFLAKEMNMSRTSFYRKFMSVMDISPKDFITKYRINKAIELIKSGNDNFGEISYTCGFGSQSNFSVLFKKEKGVTPLQFKKTL